MGVKIIALAIALIAIACGGAGDDSRMLQLTGHDETAANYRTRIAALMRSNQAPLMLSICNQIQDMKPAGALNILRARTDPDEVPPGSHRKAGQVAVENDLVRAAEIFQDECQQAFPRR